MLLSQSKPYHNGGDTIIVFLFFFHPPFCISQLQLAIQSIVQLRNEGGERIELRNEGGEGTEIGELCNEGGEQIELRIERDAN